MTVIQHPGRPPSRAGRVVQIVQVIEPSGLAGTSGSRRTCHAKAAYDTIGADPATASARAVLQWLTTTRPAQVTTRDLMRGMRDRFPKAADLNAPLQILESRDVYRARTQAHIRQPAQVDYVDRTEKAQDR
jgi:hypothetical protein